MVIDFSQLDFSHKPILVLKNLDGTAIQTLGYAFNIEVELSYNEISTLTFDIPAYVDGGRVPNYENVVGMRIVELVGCGQFLLTDPSEENDGIRKVKSCKAYSLEYEFTKKDIYLESGTYNFFSGTNVQNEDTIIGRIAERLPDWKFDIDESLIGKYRTFDDTNKKVYDFIKSDVQETYGCIFDFDTYNRIVHVISVASVVPTKQVYLSSELLIKKINTDEDSDSIVTCLDVNGAEGVTIRSVNPTGTNKLYNLDYFMTEENFPKDFIDRWHKWESDCQSKQEIYYQNTMLYNMKLLQILTGQAAYRDLYAELAALENVQAAIIGGIAQGIKTQSDLTEINDSISAKKNEMSVQEANVADLKAQASSLHQTLEDVSKQLRFDAQDETGSYSYFTPDELKILKRYFIEDTLQDSSFVLHSTVSYDNTDLNHVILDTEAEITSNSGGHMRVEDASGNIIEEYDGGTITADTFCAKIIKGTFCRYANGEAVFTAYLESGTVENESFQSGNITISSNDYSVSSADENSASLFIRSGKLYFTKDTTEYEKHQIEWELYEYGKQVLREHASPTYNFTVDCGNFLCMDDFAAFKDELTLGQRVYLKLDDEIYKPYVVSVHINFEALDSFSIEFSSAYTSFDKAFSIAKLLEQSISMGKSLSYKSGAYASFINSGASTKVKEFMDSAIDLAKNAVLSSKNQAITFDDTGLRIRKWADDAHTKYEPEEIWAVDNMIVFTDNSWETAKMAIGKIFDPNLVSTSNPTGMAYGIAAPYIVGTLLAGQNLIIESTKPDGEHTAFRVDGSGASLYNAAFAVSDDRRQIILDPSLGFGIGSGNIITVDSDGNEVWNTDGNHAKFWVDVDGNVHINGTLEGCDGKFSGVVQASDFLDSSGESMVDALGKIKSGYLNLNGINVGDGNFVVNEYGEVSMNGSITMSPGSSINWANVTESNVSQSAAYQYAIDNAFNDEKLFNALTNDGTKFGVFSAENGKLFINASYINSGTINADLIQTGVLNAGLICANDGIYISFEDPVATPALYTQHWDLWENVRITLGDRCSDTYVQNNYPNSIYFEAYDGCIFNQTPRVYTYDQKQGSYGVFDVITTMNIQDYISNVAVFG